MSRSEQQLDSIDKNSDSASGDSERQARLNKLLLDSLPHAAMLIRKDRIILAANKLATEVGALVGGVCWHDFGQCGGLTDEHKACIKDGGSFLSHETHCTFCLADKALSKQKPLNDPTVRAFDRIWDTYWVPLDDEVYLHYAIDITERISRDNSIKESEHRLRELIDSTDAGYFFIDTDGMFQDVNQAWLSIHGYGTRDEVIGKPFTITQIEGDQDDAAAVVKALLESETPISGDFSRLCKDGSIGHHLFTAHPVMKDGHVVGLEGFLIDRTEQLQTERNYQELFNKMLDGFALHEMIYDKDGNPTDYRFLAVNQPFETLTTLKASDIIGKTVLSALPETEQYWIDTYGRVVQTGEPVFISNYAQALDKHFEVTAYKSGEKRFVTIFRDVTETKLAATREEDLREQLARAERLKSLAVLAGGVAHDLNNVLGPMVLLPEMMNEDIEDAIKGRPESRELISESLEVIQSSANRASVVVRDLVALSRRGQYERIPTDINKLSCLVDSPIGAKEAHPEVGISYEFSSDKLTVLASSDHLCRVLHNLTRNAVESISGKGTVTISTFRKSLKEDYVGYNTIPRGHYAVLAVSDTGEGIAEENLSKIFEPFYTRKNKSDRSGSGLGLSVVHGVIGDHDGFIDVASEVGNGTTFSLFLPLIENEVIPADGDAEESIPTGTEQVLIVDDEPAQRFLARRSMQKLGYTISEAENGNAALALFEEAIATGNPSPFDVVLLDMIMDDGYDGLDTLNNIVKLYPAQKVIIVSGHAEDDRSQASRDLGAAWLAKPYNMGELARAVRKKLDA